MIDRRQPLIDGFDGPLDSRWEVTQIGGAAVTAAGALTMTCGPTAAGSYTNAQLCDYRADSYHFLWAPPLRLTVVARASAPADELRGTAGFGFWNHPFSPDARRMRLPRALWFFFASPPSQMALAYGVPGFGWKAATLDATRRSAWALLAASGPLALLNQFPPLYRRLWPRAQRLMAISERLLAGTLLAETHTYEIDWRRDGATFRIDGAVVHEAPDAPRGAMGFITWIDNQYAVVTPRGRLGFGLVPVERPQSLTVERLEMTPYAGGGKRRI